MAAYTSVLLQTAPKIGHFCLTFPDKKYEISFVVLINLAPVLRTL